MQKQMRSEKLFYVSFAYNEVKRHKGSRRVLRGGSWINSEINEQNFRPSNRNNNEPSNRNNNNGFRLVLVSLSAHRLPDSFH